MDPKAKDELHKRQQELSKFPDFFDKEGNILKRADLTKLPDEGKKHIKNILTINRRSQKKSMTISLIVHKPSPNKGYAMRLSAGLLAILIRAPCKRKTSQITLQSIKPMESLSKTIC